jgi:5'-3' exonuclease
MLALATHEPHFCILREQVLMRSYRHKKVFARQSPVSGLLSAVSSLQPARFFIVDNRC